MASSYDPFDVEYSEAGTGVARPQPPRDPTAQDEGSPERPATDGAHLREQPSGSYVVEVDEDLEDLIPDFMANRRKEIERMVYALQAGDFSTIQAGGHVLKGSGGGYGFDFVTEVGAELEEMAKASDADGIRSRLETLRDYLDRVRVVFV